MWLQLGMEVYFIAEAFTFKHNLDTVVVLADYGSLVADMEILNSPLEVVPVKQILSWGNVPDK